MNSKELSVAVGCGILMLSSILAAGEGTRSFPASNGDRFKLDLDAGGEVHIKGSGGSAVSVSYDLACDPDCEIDLDDTGEDLEIRTRFAGRGRVASPPQLGKDFDRGEDRDPETVQISTMGGAIEIDDAPEGAELHTMGGNIEVHSAGGDVHLISMNGDIVLPVPAGFGMDLDLEIAFTKDRDEDYHIDLPGGPDPTTTSEWDRSHGSPRRYIRSSGSVGGGGHAVHIRTINGNIKIEKAS